MKIAILTSGIRPVPAVHGGAVENLVDFYLDYNNQHRLHDITVYGIWCPEVTNHPALQSKVNHYISYKVNSYWNKLMKFLFQHRHHEGHYHYAIEFYLHQAMKDIQKKHYDMIIVENRPNYILELTEGIKAKFILHLHNDFLNVNNKDAQSIYNGYYRIISVSDFITNKVNSINTNCPKCITIHNAVDIEKFANADRINRITLCLQAHDFVIVYSGRLNEEKGILPLVQAIKGLNMIPNLKLLIIGASSYGKDKHPTQFIEQLEKESESIKDKLVFTGYIDYEQVPSYLKTADIAVVPSMWEEPFGLTVVEAMAAGLPLVTTRSGGIPEICEGVATIVERENVVENLTKAILDLYEHPDKRTAMAKESLERSKMFDKETYAKNFFAAITNR